MQLLAQLADAMNSYASELEGDTLYVYGIDSLQSIRADFQQQDERLVTQVYVLRGDSYAKIDRDIIYFDMPEWPNDNQLFPMHAYERLSEQVIAELVRNITNTLERYSGLIPVKNDIPDGVEYVKQEINRAIGELDENMRHYYLPGTK